MNVLPYMTLAVGKTQRSYLTLDCTPTAGYKRHLENPMPDMESTGCPIQIAIYTIGACLYRSAASAINKHCAISFAYKSLHSAIPVNDYRGLCAFCWAPYIMVYVGASLPKTVAVRATTHCNTHNELQKRYYQQD